MVIQWRVSYRDPVHPTVLGVLAVSAIRSWAKLKKGKAVVVVVKIEKELVILSSCALSQSWIKDYVTVEASVTFYVHHPAGSFRNFFYFLKIHFFK
jgi:hypothetical protein